MEPSFLRFVWAHSARDQIVILAITAATFPLVYLSLEVPKTIINDAIQGEGFPRRVLGAELDRIPYLLALCGLFLALVAAINGLKWLLNMRVGMTAERMLRRMRTRLFEQVLRFRLARFRTTRPAEVVQTMLGEIEPLGGFVGEVIATPAFQGGQLLVNLAFIFVQDPLLGAAAIALYPVQMLLIPRLQRKVVRLNRARATNTRALADALGDSVAHIDEVHVNGAARWRLAQISARLHRNTAIRAELFARKYTIKAVQNLLNQLTPFFFYAIGGWMAIEGRLGFGSLVAVLAAHKELSGPFRELMAYGQRWTDFTGRYGFVLEGFLGEDVHPPARLDPAPGERLAGALVFEGVEGGPVAGNLDARAFAAAPGETAAVLGGDGAARGAFLRMAAGLAEPQKGAVTLGGRALADVPIAVLGASVGYAPAEPGLAPGSIRDNLVYGLLRAEPPLAGRRAPDAVEMTREARLTGAIMADPDGDWIDYAAAGAADGATLDARLAALAEAVGLAPELTARALAARLSAETARRWDAPVRAARAALETSLDPAERADLVSPWARDAFNPDARLLDNILFAALPEAEAADPLADPVVARILARSGADVALARIGADIARELADAVAALGRDSRVLDGLGGYPRAMVLAAADLAGAAGGDGPAPPGARPLLVGLAARFTPARDGLDVLDEARVAGILALRAACAPLVAGAGLPPLDGDGAVPGLSVAEAVLRGRRRHDRRSAWSRVDALLAEAFARSGLGAELVTLGLGTPAGPAGGALSPAARRRIGLIRAVVKRPALVVLDGVAGGTGADAALRAAVRAAAPDAILVYAADSEEAAAGADIVARVSDGGVVSVERRAPPREPAARAAS